MKRFAIGTDPGVWNVQYTAPKKWLNTILVSQYEPGANLNALATPIATGKGQQQCLSRCTPHRSPDPGNRRHTRTRPRTRATHDSSSDMNGVYLRSELHFNKFRTNKKLALLSPEKLNPNSLSP